MGKLIAVWGTPEAGKTTFSVKLAETIYRHFRERRSVVLVFTDDIAPAIPVIFPNYKYDASSIGAILSKPDFFADDIAANFVIPKGHMNLAFLGYKAGENTHSYPAYTMAKAKYFYDVLVGIADYVIVDCMSMPDFSLLTKVALENADQTVRLDTPDLKCISFRMSQMKIFASHGYLKDSDVSVMNIPRQELNLSAADTRTHLGKIEFTLPYCPGLMEQYMEGILYEGLKDKRFMQTVKAIAEKLV